MLDGHRTTPASATRSCGVGPRPATARASSTRVHAPEHVALLEAFRAAGGGQLDADTAWAPASSRPPLLAAGAGLDAVERARRRRGRRRVLRRAAARAPRHARHRPMGFCLLNNVAVTAAALADARRAGARSSTTTPTTATAPRTPSGRPPRRLRVAPPVAALPGHRRPATTSAAATAAGTTVNVPLPPGATGDVYLRRRRRRWSPRWPPGSQPTWLLALRRLRRPPGRSAHRPRRCRPATSPPSPRGCSALVPRRAADRLPRGRLRPRRARRPAPARAWPRWRADAVAPEAPTAGGPGRTEVSGRGRPRARSQADSRAVPNPPTGFWYGPFGQSGQRLVPFGHIGQFRDRVRHRIATMA